MTPARLYLVAAEASGDRLGREVIDAIKSRRPDIAFSGIGGSEMAKAGIQSPIDTSPLSVLGFVEGLKAYSTATRLADQAVDDIVANRPQAVILIDSWGFMIRIAQRLRAKMPDIHIIKLVGPQVWATRAGRAKTLAAAVDHLLCIHDFEQPYYAPYGLKTTVIGNPAMGRTEKGDGAAFRAAHGIATDAQVLLVLPGSRPSEIKRVAPVLMEAAKLLKTEMPDLAVVVSPAASVAEAFDAAFPGAGAWTSRPDGEEGRLNAMAAADLALACSGTVTTELAVQGTPMIVGYKTGWITWAIARGFLYQKTHITLLNIASDDTEIVPELVQTAFAPAAIAERAGDLLIAPERLAALKAAQDAALLHMGPMEASSADLSAKAILADLDAL